MDSLLTVEEINYLSELAHQAGDTEAELQKDALIKKRLNMKSVLETDAGRAVIWDILSSCGIFSTTMTGNSQMYFKEGRRAVGLEVLAEVSAASPDTWIEMQREKMIEIQRQLTERDD